VSQGSLIGDGVRPEEAGSDLVAKMLEALREESDALKSGDPARLASARARKRRWLRLLCKDESGRVLCARRRP
jgi:hypothetical protein